MLQMCHFLPAAQKLPDYANETWKFYTNRSNDLIWTRIFSKVLKFRFLVPYRTPEPIKVDSQISSWSVQLVAPRGERKSKIRHLCKLNTDGCSIGNPSGNNGNIWLRLVKCIYLSQFHQHLFWFLLITLFWVLLHAIWISAKRTYAEDRPIIKNTYWQ